MLMSGEYAVEHVRQLDGSRVNGEDIETHGIELGIDKIYALDGNSFISNDGYKKPNRTEIKPRRTGSLEGKEDNNFDDVAKDVIQSEHYTLNKGNYVVQYDKIIRIPDNMVGFVLPRSRLMRSGIHLTTAVWECGYEGIGEGGLYVDNQAFIKSDTRIGQIVMAKAEVFDKYSGSHQGEKLDNE